MKQIPNFSKEKPKMNTIQHQKKFIIATLALGLIANTAVISQVSADSVTYPDGHTVKVIEQSNGQAILDNPQLTIISNDDNKWYDNGTEVIYHADSDKASHLDAPKHEEPTTPHLDNNVPSQDKASHLDAPFHDEPTTTHLDNNVPSQDKSSHLDNNVPSQDKASHLDNNVPAQDKATHLDNNVPESEKHESSSSITKQTTQSTDSSIKADKPLSVVSSTTQNKTTATIESHSRSNANTPAKANISQPQQTSSSAVPSTANEPVQVKTTPSTKHVQTLNELPTTGDDKTANTIATAIGILLIAFVIYLITGKRKGKRKGKHKR